MRGGQLESAVGSIAFFFFSRSHLRTGYLIKCFAFRTHESLSRVSVTMRSIYLFLFPSFLTKTKRSAYQLHFFRLADGAS
jgi:hypothetical protein